MKLEGLSVRDVAEGVGVSDVMIYQLLNKKRKPSRPLRLAFQTYTRGEVGEMDWGPYPGRIGPKKTVFPFERTNSS